jgi:hypothetical protein
VVLAHFNPLMDLFVVLFGLAALLCWLLGRRAES